MGFTLYRIIADHVIPRADIAGEAWVCQTEELATKLMAELQETRTDLTNFQLITRHYGA
ncbi:hypothetical protein S-CBP2_0003 [Synechococcus phage S-CBP2]|uniref:Uncharacterized protein n=1 Tax=Synechococcus phage S-CBP2 TaxID=756277 RepID=A0A096VKX0_9CAUD|nr:hypothetical protein S-CBP2_0003 [Synechococcus phage S-CBP2]AGF91126.1 hypothetical protein SXHG_00104 [Synechococcus phage MRHenn-2013a]AGK86709.1 hypothetical protein S-CBP2_0003 [Synechococcus phage S-CBP2]